ncbi:MAG: hypothetical protein JO269_01450 [Burkholderiaceae bacterium]|nr:hypothetical protein [Burkholderiaceae bacterium]
MSTKSASRVPSFIQQAVDQSAAERFKRPAPAVPDTRARDNFLAVLIAVVVVALAAISAFVWTHARKADVVEVPKLSSTVAGPYQVEAQKYTIIATLSVQTNADDTGWVKENQKGLDIVLKQLLADNVNAGTIKSPGGLQNLQDALTKGTNAAFGAQRVQAVLLTDFSTQSRQ